MKRIFTLILALSLLALTACSGGGTSNLMQKGQVPLAHGLPPRCQQRKRRLTARSAGAWPAPLTRQTTVSVQTVEAIQAFTVFSGQGRHASRFPFRPSPHIPLFLQKCRICIRFAGHNHLKFSETS